MDFAKTIVNRAFILICVCQVLAAALAVGEVMIAG